LFFLEALHTLLETTLGTIGPTSCSFTFSDALGRSPWLCFLPTTFPYRSARITFKSGSFTFRLRLIPTDFATAFIADVADLKVAVIIARMRHGQNRSM
jgi:hypothetical protein